MSYSGCKWVERCKLENCRSTLLSPHPAFSGVSGWRAREGAGLLGPPLCCHFQVLRALPGRRPSSEISAAAGEVVGEVGTFNWTAGCATSVRSEAGSAYSPGTGWSSPHSLQLSRAGVTSTRSSGRAFSAWPVTDFDAGLAPRRSQEGKEREAARRLVVHRVPRKQSRGHGGVGERASA